MKKITLSILTLLFAVITANAQITLVKDLVTSDGDSFPFNYLDGGNFTVFITSGFNGSQVWASDGTEAGTVNIGANITDIFNVFEESIVYNNELFFVIENGTTGAELYKTDGTLAGTSIVKEINTNGFGSNPENFIILNNELFFTADDGINGTQLWKTDGSEAGTTTVTTKSAFPSNLKLFNNEIYFRADDNSNVSQLWKTDGTDAGTNIVKIINGANGSFPENFTMLNNELFFTATTDAEGTELWKTDGTDAGTVLVKDINTGNLSSNIDNITVNNNTMYFTADNNSNGSELWKSDGTTIGTVLVKDINAGAPSTNFADFLNLNATITLFIAETTNEGREIWRTDGTEAGTVLVKDINPGSDFGVFEFNGFSFKSLVFNGEAYFRANDGVTGNELWKTNGTEAGTVLVKDINANANADNGNGLMSGLFILNNKIILEAFNTSFNRELWISDGTEAGTTLLHDNNPGIGWGAFLENNIVVNGNLLFNGSNGNNGFELWKTDGTSAGTIQLKNIEDTPNGSNPQELVSAFDKVFFRADSTSFSNPRLYVSDGTTNGTLKVGANNQPAKSPQAIVEYDNKIFYSSPTFVSDLGIFYTDANGVATTFVKQINPNENENADITEFYNAKGLNKLFFAANDGTNGKELWVSDGTAANTNLVLDIEAGTEGSNPQDFFEWNNEVYFMTIKNQGSFFNPSKKRTLWKTDGTAAGTILLREFDFRSIDIQPYFTVFNNKLHFSAYEMSSGGNFIWATDGTAANTVLETGIANNNRNLIVMGNELFFSGQPINEARKLYKYNGTDASLVKDFNAGNFGGYSPIEDFVDVVNGNYYFVVNLNNVSSLWKTDGTEAGTIMLKDDFTFVTEIVQAGDIIYFSADDGINGQELWKSDGTVSGTELVEDFFTGNDNFGTPNGASPSNLMLSGDDLYFAANSAVFGRELFKLDNVVLSTNNEVVSNLEIKFNVYPNPASSTIKIFSTQQITRLELFNLLGKKISEISPQETSFNVSNLANGLYILKAKINNKIMSKKLIIK